MVLLLGVVLCGNQYFDSPPAEYLNPAWDLRLRARSYRDAEKKGEADRFKVSVTVSIKKRKKGSRIQFLHLKLSELTA